jgi:hypothetical protein
MDKRYLLISSTAILAILVSGLAVYAWQALPNNSQLRAQARITDLTADTSFKGCLVGVTTDIWFNVTVQNTGKTDITGANVTVEISGVNDSSICNYDNQSLGILHANESRLVKAIILTDISHFYQVASSNFTAKLIVNGTVWDERTYYNSTPIVTSTSTINPTTAPNTRLTVTYSEVSRNESMILINFELEPNSYIFQRNASSFYLTDNGARIPSNTNDVVIIGTQYSTLFFPINHYNGTGYSLTSDNFPADTIWIKSKVFSKSSFNQETLT